MRSQQQVEGHLLRLYGRTVALCLVLAVMAIMGLRYFSTAPDMGSRHLEIEHTRLLTILAMVRSQWLSLGKPSQLQLNWEITGLKQLHDKSSVLMNTQGAPQPPSLSSQGCQQLWLQLMGSKLNTQAFVASYYTKDNSCRFMVNTGADQGGSLAYQLDSGRVIFQTLP